MRKHNKKKFITLRVNASLYYLKELVLTVGLIGFAVATVILVLNLNTVRKQNTAMQSTLTALDETLEGVTDTDILEKKLAELKRTKKNYKQLQKDYDELNTKLVNMTTDMVILDQENTKLIKNNDDYEAELANLSERINKYEQYQWVVFDPDTGKRTDITYDELVTAEDICLKNGVDPDLLFAILMTESRGDEDAISVHNAIGLGQVKSSTAVSVYEDIMGNGKGTFNSSMLWDGEQNIKIASNYICYLVKQYSSLSGAIDGYRGLHDASYYKRITHFLSYAGKTLDQIENEILTYKSDPTAGLELMVKKN